MRIVFKAWDDYMKKRGNQFKIKLPVFRNKICLHFNNNFVSAQVVEILFPRIHENKNSQIFLWWHWPSDPPNVFGTNHICSTTSLFAWTILNKQYFHNHWSVQIFFTSGISPNILMDVLEDCIKFLVWVACVLFNF